MSFSSLYTGISGLDTYSQAMAVIGNNIANVNTIGYKTSRIDFEEMLSQNLVGVSGQYQIGTGVDVSTVKRVFTQSNFQSTASATDLAIDGDGFFIVSDGILNYYTRAGHFYKNQDGKLVNNHGYVLQGYQFDENGDIAQNVLTDIDLSSVSSEPKATESVRVDLNLNSAETATGAAFDPDDTSTYHFSTTVTAYDSLGNSHFITMYFTKTADNAWSWNTTIDGDYAAGNPSGTLTFTEEGKLDTESASTFTLNFGGGVADQDITFDFGSSLTTDGGTGEGTSQYAAPSSALFLSQDGYSAGDVISVQIDSDGIVRGVFSNGQFKELFQMVLARFQSPEGLESIGGNLFQETNQSGEALVGVSSTAGMGRINSNSLELSNVDLAHEFVEMIKTQQAFQANSRVITTTDQLLQEVVNLRR